MSRRKSIHSRFIWIHRAPVLFFFLSLTAYCLLPTAYFSQSGTPVQGSITDESDRPVANAVVTLSGQGFSQSALSQADGKYALTVPRPGAYTVSVRADGYRPYQQDIAIIKPEEPLVLGPLRLLPVSLRVTVVDVRTNEKLGGGMVTIKGTDNAVRRAIEASRGEYYFGRLPSGVYDLTVAMTGYEPRVADRVLVGGTTVEQIVGLVRTTTIPLGIKARDRSFTTPRLPSNQINSLYADSDGGIWFATGNGVCRYNGRDFESSERAESPLHQLNGSNVLGVYRTRDRVLWVASDRGVFIQTEPGKPVEPFVPASALPPVRHFLEDRSGTLWMATTRGLAGWDGQVLKIWGRGHNFTDTSVKTIVESRQTGGLWAATEEGLFRFDGSWQPVTNDLADLTGIAEDASGHLWLTAGRGLFRLEGTQPVPVSLPPLQKPLAACLFDAQGNLWCAGADRGVVVYDPRRQEAGEWFPGDRVSALLADREGQLWFGTDSGAVRQDLFSFVAFDAGRGLTDSDVRAIDTAEQKLWIGTSRGLVTYDGVRFQGVGREELSIHGLLRLDDGRLAVGTTRGLSVWNGTAFTRVESPVLAGDMRGLLRDGKRPLIWASTPNSVIPLNAQSLIPEGEPVRIDGEVRSVMQASSGSLWIATNKGAYRYDPTTAELVVLGTDQGLKSADVWAIYEHSPGRFWLATGNGVECYDGVRFDADPLCKATEGRAVTGLFADRDGFMWVCLGDGGVRKFARDVPELTRLYPREKYDFAGLRVRGLAQTADGALWFASEGGLTRHLPNRVAPTVEIGLEVDGAEIPQPSPVDIGAGQHRIRLRFTGISTMGEVGYQYRLRVDGREGWKFVDSEREKNEVTLANLPPGEHVFEVRAINRDLYGWQSEPARFVVRIDRPVYQKSWFWIVGGLIAAGGGGGIWAVQQRKRREYLLPPALRVFQPIEQNPYIVGNPIRLPRMFFGREDDFNYVSKKLEGTAQGLVIVLCGERRTGKSSILYQIWNGRLGSRFVPVFIDMQEMIVGSDAEFLQRVALLIRDALARIARGDVPVIGRADTVSVPDPRQYPFTQAGANPFDLFRDFIGETLDRIGDRQLILLVDEYELIETKAADGKLTSDIFGFLAGTIDRYDRLSMIFTGSKKLEQRDRRYWREMLRRSLFRKISFLSRRDTERLIVEPVRERVVHGRGVVNAIYRLTAGQPFYTQVICQNIVDFLNEQKRNYILRADLETIVGEIVDNPLPQMIYFWEGLSDDEKLVMSLVAEALADGEARTTAERLARTIVRNDYPVTLSENTIRLTLEELYRSEILIKENDDRFAYRIDLMRAWIKRSHSIWQVVREVKTL